MNRVTVFLVVCGLSCLLVNDASAQRPKRGGPPKGRGPDVKQNEEVKGLGPKHDKTDKGPGAKRVNGVGGPGGKKPMDKDFAALIRAAVDDGIIGQRLADYIQERHQNRGPAAPRGPHEGGPKGRGHGVEKQHELAKDEREQKADRRDKQHGPPRHKKPKKRIR